MILLKIEWCLQRSPSNNYRNLVLIIIINLGMCVSSSPGCWRVTVRVWSHTQGPLFQYISESLFNPISKNMLPLVVVQDTRIPDPSPLEEIISFFFQSLFPSKKTDRHVGHSSCHGAREKPTARGGVTFCKGSWGAMWLVEFSSRLKNFDQNKQPANIIWGLLFFYLISLLLCLHELSWS